MMIKKKKYYVFKIDLVVLNIVSTILLVLCFLITGLVFPNTVESMFILFSDAKNLLLLLP